MMNTRDPAIAAWATKRDVIPSGEAPLLSVIVPTRNRAELARACVRRLLADARDDVEIIVLENSDQAEISERDFEAPGCLRIYPSDGALDMPSNWERGLAIARGHYVTYVADKDMFLPGALHTLLATLSSKRHEIVCYRKAIYCSHRDILFHYRCHGAVHEERLRPMAEQLFRTTTHIHSGPMIYNSAVSRGLIADIQGSRPRFFIGNSPDVITAVLFAAHRERYAQLDETLSVGHSGDWSNGYTFVRHGRYNERSADFTRLFKRDPGEYLGIPACVPSGILEVLLTARNAYPQELAGFAVDWRAYLENVHRAIDAMEITRQEKARELRILASRGCVVPRAEYNAFRLNRVKQALWTRPLQHLLRLKMRAFPRGFGLSRYLGKPAGTGEDRPRSPATGPARDPWWSDAHYNCQTRTHSIEEALAVAASSNQHHHDARGSTSHGAPIAAP